jgi:hypothetical protein
MRLCSVVAIIGLVCLGGCGSGDTGPTRYRLTGNVTFNGKPVKNGAVQLNPKTGEFGGGGATIEDGWYDTAGGGTQEGERIETRKDLTGSTEVGGWNPSWRNKK